MYQGWLEPLKILDLFDIQSIANSNKNNLIFEPKLVRKAKCIYSIFKPCDILHSEQM